MDCPACATGVAAFPVPDAARPYAPEDGAAGVAICPSCLTVTGTADLDASTGSGAFEDALPAGEAGGVMAIAVGLLADSVALHSDAVLDLFELVADTGADPWLVLERLDADPWIAPGVDVDRWYRQLQQLS